MKRTPEEKVLGVVIRFDVLKDSQYPNGAWYATIDDPDPEAVYDKFYGDTPDEALAAFNKDLED
jgi:hypothetical protein